MRRYAALLFCSLVAIVSCKGTVGPMASTKRDQKPPDPLYNSNSIEQQKAWAHERYPLTSTEEQKAWARERYPLPEDDPNIAPRTYIGTYGPNAR